MNDMILSFLAKLIPSKTVYAHCDIPCGIYDPTPAQIAAHSVLRMTQMILEAEKEEGKEGKAKYISQIARLTKVKEEHAEALKHEVRVIWGDYFKEENLVPGLHEKVFEIMHLTSKARQGVDIEVSNKLLSSVQEFAEIFYKSKKLEPVRIPSGYPTGGEIVTHK